MNAVSDCRWTLTSREYGTPRYLSFTGAMTTTKWKCLKCEQITEIWSFGHYHSPSSCLRDAPKSSLVK